MLQDLYFLHLTTSQPITLQKKLTKRKTAIFMPSLSLECKVLPEYHLANEFRKDLLKHELLLLAHLYTISLVWPNIYMPCMPTFPEWKLSLNLKVFVSCLKPKKTEIRCAPQRNTRDSKEHHSLWLTAQFIAVTKHIHPQT